MLVFLSILEVAKYLSSTRALHMEKFTRKLRLKCKSGSYITKDVY